ncbi:unnamed protein product [Rotaria sp. Silwood2]|nr:unnamed protein product [Rotaria sp. Silwood2]
MLLSIAFYVLMSLTVTEANLIICPTLNSAANFTVIAASSVSNTGLTVINGNLAISPSISLTGFNPTGVINGITELGTVVALQAQKDVTSAYNDLKGAPITAQMTGIDLTSKTLVPGIYKFDSAAGIDTPAGILTLNGTGIYIFQISSALTTSAYSEIRGINGAKASCIFWQVGSSATLGQILRDEDIPPKPCEPPSEPQQKKFKTVDTLFTCFQDDYAHDNLKDNRVECDYESGEYEYDTNQLNELDQYLIRKIDKSSITNNSLDFWRCHTKQFLLLCKLVKRIYSIPATSCNVER